MSSNLAARIEALGRSQHFTPAELEDLRDFVASAPDEALFRVNPLTYAAERGMPEHRAIDLFVHAGRAGIFDLAWNVLCYGCGGYLQSGHALGELSAQTHCAVCDLDVEATLDDAVEVSFTVAPAIRSIRYHRPNELAPGPELLRYIFSSNRLRSPEVEAVMGAARVMLEFLPPLGTKSLALELSAGAYRLVSASHHANCHLQVSAGASQTMIDLHDQAFLGATALAAGPVTLQITNTTERPATVALINLSALPDMPDACEAYRAYRPFLTGKRILTSQAFRDLYRNHSMAPGSSFSLRSLTFLFTDLKDSTQLYDRIGDLSAYELVQEHFKILSETVSEHEGAIVKTIGDAIMATFPRPESAVAAAAEMNRKLSEWNRRSEVELFLKIGIHEGACIAVSSNDRIDYFGQTVNQAARIQALAGAGEIYLSEAVYSSQGVAQVGQIDYLEPQVVQLKGISEKVTVYPAVVPTTVVAS
ncbi:MAG TPA: DUF5939 domain-containing protein [Stenomitos sp.]